MACVREANFFLYKRRLEAGRPRLVWQLPKVVKIQPPSIRIRM